MSDDSDTTPRDAVRLSVQRRWHERPTICLCACARACVHSVAPSALLVCAPSSRAALGAQRCARGRSKCSARRSLPCNKARA